MLLAMTVEPWTGVLHYSEALWELTERQLAPEDRNAKTMDWTVADRRNLIHHHQNSTTATASDSNHLRFLLLCP